MKLTEGLDKILSSEIITDVFGQFGNILVGTVFILEVYLLSIGFYQHPSFSYLATIFNFNPSFFSVILTIMVAYLIGQIFNYLFDFLLGVIVSLVIKIIFFWDEKRAGLVGDSLLNFITAGDYVNLDEKYFTNGYSKLIRDKLGEYFKVNKLSALYSFSGLELFRLAKSLIFRQNRQFKSHLIKFSEDLENGLFVNFIIMLSISLILNLIYLSLACVLLLLVIFYYIHGRKSNLIRMIYESAYILIIDKESKGK